MLSEGASLAVRPMRTSTRYLLLSARTAAVAAAVLALATLLPARAHADDMDAARQLFAEGVKVFQRGGGLGFDFDRDRSFGKRTR